MDRLESKHTQSSTPEKRAKQITGFMFGTLIFTLFIFLGLLIYSRSSPGTAPHQIYYVGKTSNMSIEFWRTIDEGLNDAAKEFNVNLTKLNASDEGRVDENLALFQEAVAAKPEAIILSASDYAVLSEPVAAAVRSGQKIIMLDSDVKRIEGAEPLSLIATNNRAAGQALAAHFSNDLDRDAKIVIIVQQDGVATADQRRQGILDVLQEKSFTDITTIDARGSKEIARTELLNLLEKSEVEMVVAVNEYTTEAAALALKEVDQDGRIPLVGIDFSRLLVPFIEDGTIKATVVQQPYNIAYLSVKAAIDSLEGKNIPAQIDVESKLITKELLFLPENQKLLFPFQNAD